MKNLPETLVPAAGIALIAIPGCTRSFLFLPRLVGDSDEQGYTVKYLFTPGENI